MVALTSGIYTTLRQGQDVSPTADGADCSSLEVPARRVTALTPSTSAKPLLPQRREARKEAEALRQRLASAEAHAERLQQENQSLRVRLGEPDELASPLTSPLGSDEQMHAAPKELAPSREAQAAEQTLAEPMGGSDFTEERPAQQPADQSAPSLMRDQHAVGSLMAEQPGAGADTTRTADAVLKESEVDEARS